MKKEIKTIQTFFLISVFILCTFASCKKETNTINATPTPMGTVEFHIHTAIHTSEVDSGMVAMDASGRHFQLDAAEFFFSGIRLKKEDNTWLSLSNVYLLKTIDEEVYLVGSVPAGNYLSASFNVGIDAAANLTTPSSHPSGPLSDTSMWFGSAALGYKFMNVTGWADTSGDAMVDIPFSFQLGTNVMLKQVTLPDQLFTVLTDQNQFLHIIADYGVLMNGVDFKTQNNATPFSNAATTIQIANNVPNMFHYE